MEQKIYERSVTKQAVACRVVDEQQIDRHYNMSDLSELYKLDEAGSSVSAGLAVGVHDAALLRVACADEAGAALHAVHEHDSLLRSSESGLNETERAAAWTQFQQEQTATHTKIQNIEIEQSATAHKSSNKIVLKTEPQTQEEPDQQKNTTAGKTKRGRKATTNIYTNSQPSTSRQSDNILNSEAEEQMIKKIMSILIKHNFHTTRSPQEISDLVVNVRNVVANAKQGGLDNADPLIASIASVLLENENIPLPELNTNNVDKCVSNCTEVVSNENMIGIPNDEKTNNGFDNNEKSTIEEEYPERKRRRTRRISDEEYVPEKNRRKKKVVPEVVSGTEKPKTRKSNGNILTISPNDESLNTSKIQLIETQEPIPTDIDINIPLEPQLVNSGSSRKVSVNEVKKNKGMSAESSKQSEAKSLKENKLTHNNTLEESIVLSDDDDEPIQNIKSATAVTTCSDSLKNAEEDKNEPDDEIIPLHKSLLTNKSFIKIVAHTYLSGNPMLDEDAAILAAQYSTLKALKEMNSTGKDITSGPIYDIAVQVLGKDLLKKLKNVRVNANETIKLDNIDNQTDITAKSSTESNQKKDTVPLTITSKLYENKVKKKQIKPEIRKDTVLLTNGSNRKMKVLLPQETEQNKNFIGDSVQVYDEESIEVQEDTLVVTEASIPDSSDHQNVVPVGIFKGPASLHTSNMVSSQDECILPDDDDVIMTPLTTSHVTPTITENNTTRRNSKRLFIKTVVSDNNKTTVTPENEITTTPIKLIAVQRLSSTVSTKPNELSTTNSTNYRISNIETNNSTNIQVPIIKEQVAAETSNPVVSAQISETICLDSDEEDVVATVCNNTKPVSKALKSTTKFPNRSSTTVTEESSTPTNIEIPTTSRTKHTLESTKNNVINAPTTPIPKVTNTITKRLKPLKLNFKGVRSSSNAGEVSKSRNCKPGDIIRITESGVFELLRRNEISSATASSINESQAQNSATPETITGDINTESLSVREKATDKTDTSNSLLKSRSAKAKNSKPLSLHRNVHIPEDNYGESNVKTYSKYDNKASKRASSVASSALDKMMEIIKTDNKVICISDTPSTVSTRDERVPVTVFASTSKRDDKEKVIDLTESFTVQNNNDKKIVHMKKDFVAIAGTSKDIIINKTGVLLSNAKTASTPVKEMVWNVNKSKNKTTAKQNIALTLRKVQTDSVKRSSPWQEPPTNKKPKPNITKPMTLQDFNIDDIDDNIIELE
ncbi:unnamed protein product [Euphydryas editha]|uniref:Uncharacterized protein n=1 Tax=Euphydryas editha TaxID=104508 RepID=A0AAU9TU18_EUPED|nr:unnamed protein product [Euphydryas editha]